MPESAYDLAEANSVARQRLKTLNALASELDLLREFTILVRRREVDGEASGMQRDRILRNGEQGESQIVIACCDQLLVLEISGNPVLPDAPLQRCV